MPAPGFFHIKILSRLDVPGAKIYPSKPRDWCDANLGTGVTLPFFKRNFLKNLGTGVTLGEKNLGTHVTLSGFWEKFFEKPRDWCDAWRKNLGTHVTLKQQPRDWCDANLGTGVTLT